MIIEVKKVEQGWHTVVRHECEAIAEGLGKALRESLVDLKRSRDEYATRYPAEDASQAACDKEADEVIAALQAEVQA